MCFFRLQAARAQCDDIPLADTCSVRWHTAQAECLQTKSLTCWTQVQIFREASIALYPVVSPSMRFSALHRNNELMFLGTEEKFDHWNVNSEECNDVCLHTCVIQESTTRPCSSGYETGTTGGTHRTVGSTQQGSRFKSQLPPKPFYSVGYTREK